MVLPGYEWLTEHLDGVRDNAGGSWKVNTSPATGGAAFTMMVLLVAAWLVMLVPLLLWRGARRVAGR
jgi:hypothetical protein